MTIARRAGERQQRATDAMVSEPGPRQGARREDRALCDAALCDAASCGDLARLRQLLAAGVSADSADEDGTTALMAASFAGELAAVRALLEHGADPDLQDESGLTALMNAVIADGEMDLDGGHSVFIEIAMELLAAGADLLLEDRDGLTAGGYAVSYELWETVALLAARGGG